MKNKSTKKLNEKDRKKLFKKVSKYNLIKNELMKERTEMILLAVKLDVLDDLMIQMNWKNQKMYLTI